MTTETFLDYYAILEVFPDADEATIRTSYKRLAKLRHPDRNPEDSEATVQFQLLQQAYSILVDPQQRQQFDRQRQRRVRVPLATPLATPRPFVWNPKTQQAQPANFPQENVKKQTEERVRTPHEEAMRQARAEAERLDRLEREARLREYGQRMREGAMRIREAAYRFRDERDRRARQEAEFLAERRELEEAELRVMELD